MIETNTEMLMSYCEYFYMFELIISNTLQISITQNIVDTALFISPPSKVTHFSMHFGNKRNSYQKHLHVEQLLLNCT